jgi:electron transfer flavoprotein beta subunit
MKIAVTTQIVPDRIEEIVINAQKTGFELEEIAWIPNEFDDHAIEEAILIKEQSGAEVVVIAAGGEQAEEGLFTAAAKGADRMFKLNVDFTAEVVNNHALARLFASILKRENPDLVLTGVSNPNGFDGPLGSLLAELMGMPYVGYVSKVELAGNKVIAYKDYPGGVRAKLEAELPVVLGISSAQEPPRYVPISKVRQAMKTTSIEEEDGALELSGGPTVTGMYEPETTGHAEMLTGNLKDIADRIAAIIKSQGLI